MSLQNVVDEMRERVGDNCGLGAVIKFDFGEQGSLILDAKQIPNKIDFDGAEPDCTMIISLDNFKAMAEGSLDGVSAFMTGRLKVKGDMSIAMKLGALLA